jgi:hypothetical protein
MKRFIILLLLISMSVEIKAEIVRVIKKKDGSVAVMRAVGPGNDNKAYFDREQAKTMLKGLPYKDLDIKKIPKDRSKRNKWTLTGSSITVRQ